MERFATLLLICASSTACGGQQTRWEISETHDEDGDTIADVVDACPYDLEDFDAFQDDDGCPDEDNDGDSIVDTRDQCPNHAEVINQLNDLDGCPDETHAAGVVSRLRILFREHDAAVSPMQSSRLSAAAQLLVEEPILQIEIHGHGSSSEPNAARLSARRAEAVRDELIQRGVSSARLRTRAFGDAQPVNREAPAGNPRVEFKAIYEIAPR